MKVKKVNAVLALLIIVCLFGHCMTMCLLMLGVIPFSPWYNMWAHAFAALFLAHAALAMFVIFMNIESKSGSRLYAKQNITTILQRVSAIVMLLLFIKHILEHSGEYVSLSEMAQVDVIMQCIGTSLLAICAVIHTVFSVPKAFVTLGIIKSQKMVENTGKVCAIIGAMLTCFCIIALVLYSFGG